MRPTGHDPAVVRPARRRNARRTLVCLGFAGGGTGAYRAWADVLDDETDLALICYPGREGRFTEPAAGTWHELVRDTADAVRRTASTPFVLFGHSMGGWVAFDVTLLLQRHGAAVPEALVVSSCNSPVRGLTERDRFPRAGDDDESLVRWMRTSGSLPDHVLDDADMLAMALRLMRADLRVRDTYRPDRQAAVQVPLQVCHGVDDDVIEQSVAEQWQAAATGPFEITRLPGGHFYQPRIWRDLPKHFASLAAAPGFAGKES
ncbi:thioesterase II family protein [Amycolatopsis sp. lyj-346]|uniref:thioesterase II family protein n=1 Tax=Amycolatopsis sp. lyj-346 TaxID=2789289 RepID=UPI0039780D3A